MTYLLVRQRVADFDRWHSIFKSHAAAQREAGLKDPQVLRDAEDPGIVVCILKVEDPDKAKAFTETKEAGEAKNESGIIGEPEILLLNEV